MRATKDAVLSYLGELKEELQKEGIVELGLFGSYARGEAGVYSDIDIAIKRNETYLQDHSAYEYFTLIDSIKSKISARFHRQSDLFDLGSDSSMKENILKDIIYV